MDRPHYEFEYSLPYEIYSFISEGKNGRIRKMVQFDRVNTNVFNLGFGDWKDDDSGFDDVVVTNNCDMEMVLSTVVRIAVEFLTRNSGVSIYIAGSTAARTRLYRIIISNHYDQISNDFIVWGYLNDRQYRFEKNIDYGAFLVSKLL